MDPSTYNLNDEDQVTYFGETDARNRKLRFGIKRKDRAKHLYAIGKTGMGKSTLLENLAVQDILNGEGLCFLDPHGKSADLLLEYVPEHRIKDVIYFAPFDMEHPVSFNVMEDVGPEQRYLVASGMMSAFKKIWVDAWSARMEYILGNIMLALLEYPGSTLVAVNRMLTDKDFRKEVVNNITDPSVKSFWVNEYANYTEKFAAEAAPAIQNKVGQFVANPLIRNIIGQAKSSFDIRDVMDNRKILIINLSKGRVGEANANLLGSMLITKIYLGAMSRADLSEKQLEAAPNFYLYVDEFQSFANESFADILSEARKYKLSLAIAHQYIEQMSDEVRAAVFGNVGTMVTFRVGAYDAEVLEKEYAPYFLAEDIVSLQKYQMYLKLMIDGVTSPPFSASGMTPIPRSEINYTNAILDSSRSLYARPRQQVEEELLEWIQKKFGGSGGGGSSGGGGGGRSSNSASNGGENSSGGNSSSGNNNGGDRSRGASQGGSSFGGNRSSGGGQRDGRSGGYAPSSISNSAGSSQGQNRGSLGGGRDGVREGGRDSRPVGSMGGSVGSTSGGDRNRGSFSGSSSSQGITSNVSRNQNLATRAGSGATPAASSGSVSNPTPGSSMGSSSSVSSSLNASGASGPSNSSQQNSRQSGQQSAQQFKQVGNERESELRKAMSLSYLKTEAPAPKSEKIPKPENIAALREALLSVMKNEGITATQTAPTDVPSDVEPTTMSSPTPDPVFEIKQQPISTNSSMHQSAHEPKTIPDEKLRKEVADKKDTHKESDAVKNIREVNEEDLKNIFAD